MEQGLESSVAQSLLSLSMTTAEAAFVSVPSSVSKEQELSELLLGEENSGNGAVRTGISGSIGAGSASSPSVLKHHRRLSSTGMTKRRISDARDAASRPAPASLSLSGLSLNSPSHTHVPLSTSFSSAIGGSAPVNIAGDGHDTHEGSSVSAGSGFGSVPGSTNGFPASVEGYHPSLPGSAPVGVVVKPVPMAKNGKKRGMDHRCESCNKVYRHPSCLIKHRWEHTPHWRESSKYVLSKHQQVQLLEAAAILSHFSPDSANGTSLPEDRSLWPSFLSGGTLSLPESSSSVPTAAIIISSSTRATSTGPRLHDYSISAADAVKVRPGLVVANGSGGPEASNVSVRGSTPIPVPNGTEVHGYGFGYGRTSSSGPPGSRGKSWGDQTSNFKRFGSSASGVGSSVSLPRSSVRSGSSSSVSASGSGSAGRSGSSELDDDEEAEEQDEDEDDIDVDVVDVDSDVLSPGRIRYPYEYDTGVRTNMKPMKEEEEDWEMEMEMD